MITYDYATIAAGYNWRFQCNYSKIAEAFANDKNRYNNSQMYLVTNDEIESIDNLHVIKIEDHYPLYNGPKISDRDFNYNIKFLAVKEAIKRSCADYIIYVDADYRIHENHSEERMQKWLEIVKDKNWEIISPTIWCGYRDSYLSKYELYNISVEDQNNIMSYDENFFILKNNDKLKIFVEKWEELFWKITEANFPHWAEAIEIGISASHANMISSFNLCADYNFNINLPEMYYTSQNGVDRYVRF